jgi:hypothetical protein
MGDGGVSALPPRLPARRFHELLRERMTSM